MKTYQIALDDTIIEYDIIFKQMKSIYLRVKKGRLEVSAPYYTPLSLIEDNIIKYQKKILSQIKDYQPYCLYQDNGYVYIFNQKYTIRLRELGEKKCVIHDHYIYVYHHQIANCVEIFLKRMLMDYIEERIIHYLAFDFDLDMPKIEIKKYKGRWGSCFYKDNKVSFNLSLVYLDKELIDYVIVHELSHFLQANHSALFYHEIEKRLPHYKQLQKRLKEQHV